MSHQPPTTTGWFWWTPLNRSTPLMAYITTQPPKGLVATLLRENPGAWWKVSEMGGAWGGACSPEEVEEETSSLKMRWTSPPEEDFPLFI